jgi:hypothetical protein
MSTVSVDPIRLGCRLGREDARDAVAQGLWLSDRAALLRRAAAHFRRHEAAGSDLLQFGADIAWARFWGGYVLGYDEIIAADRRDTTSLERPHRAPRPTRRTAAHVTPRRSGNRI